MRLVSLATKAQALSLTSLRVDVTEKQEITCMFLFGVHGWALEAHSNISTYRYLVSFRVPVNPNLISKFSSISAVWWWLNCILSIRRSPVSCCGCCCCSHVVFRTTSGVLTVWGECADSLQKEMGWCHILRISTLAPTAHGRHHSFTVAVW